MTGTAIFILLHVESEVHDISILYDIFLAFHAHLAGFFHGGFRAVVDIVVVFDYFGTDESLLEVGMDHTGTLRGFPAFQERPGTAFVGTGGQEGLLVQQALVRFDKVVHA